MARSLTLAVYQTGPVQQASTRSETVGRLIHLIERASATGAELVVFPELALTTFFPRWALDEGEIDAFYEASCPSPNTEPLFDAARRLGIGFALGYAERVKEGGRTRRFNTMDLIGRDGALIGRYRKMHVPGSETPEAGTTVHLERRYFDPAIRGSRCSGSATYGSASRFATTGAGPRPTACCAWGAEVALIGYNTSLLLEEAPALAHLRMFHNQLPMQAGAYQNTLWVAAAKAGLEDGQALIGGSCIIAPTGEIAAQAISIADEVVVHRLDLDLIAVCRRVNFDFARYRRPAAYGLIAERAGPPKA